MKKLLSVAFATIICFCLFVGTSTAYAVSAEDEIGEKLEDEIDKSLNDLDLSGLEDLYNELSDDKLSFGDSVKSVIRGILDGELSLDASVIFNLVKDALFGGFKAILPMTLALFVIILMYRIFTSLVSGFQRESIKNIIYFVYYMAMISILSIAVGNCVSDTVKTVQSVAKVTDVLFPILLTLMTALGGVSGVALYQPLMLVLTTVIIKIISAVVLPLFMATMVFTIVGGLSKSVPLGNLTKTTKGLSEWILGTMFAIFVAIATFQGILGASADSITIKSMKFAVSSYVPILGGYLSEGFDLVMAGCVLLKNAVGLTGVVILFLVTLLPIAKILLYSFAFQFVASFAEPLGETRFPKLLFSVGKNLRTLVSVIAGVTFLVFILIIIIMLSVSPGAM